MADTSIAIDSVAPEIDALPIDTGADPGAPDAGTPGGEDEPEQPVPGEPPAPDAEPAAPKEYEPAIIGNRLSKSAWATIAKIKADGNPKLAAEIKGALFDAHNLREALPGGLKEVSELRSQIEELGGLEEIGKSREQLEYFHDLDSQFTAGDPRFVQAMLDTPEGQGGFLKLAPTMLEKFRELAPDHHDLYVAKQQFQGMLDAEVKITLLRMQDVIGEVTALKPELAEKLTQQWAPLAQYYNKIAEAAGKKLEAPKVAAATAQPNDDREQKINEREQTVLKNEWRSAGNGERLKIFNTEWSRLTKDLKLSDTQTAAVKELYASRLLKAVSKIPNFNETAQRFFSRGDKDGFLRHTTSAYRREIPVALRAAIDAIVSTKGPASTPKAAPAAAARPTAPVGAKPADGFTWINGPPDKTKVAFGPNYTTGEMIRKGQAILSDGRKVQWRKS